MKDKTRRLDSIKKLVSAKEIRSQEELLDELRAEGFKVTQATLSRDLKQLKVAKASTTKGEYVYVLPNNAMYKRTVEDMEGVGIPRDTGFVSITFSGNMAVIKTRPGYASSLAYDIDTSDIDEICGTIAGDDTIFLVLKEHISRLRLLDKFEQVIPTIVEH